MESLKVSLDEMMALFQSRMSSFEAQLQKAPSSLTTIASVSADYVSFKSFVIEALSGLHQQIDALAQGLDAVEMRGRRKILLLHGVTESEKEVPEQVITDVISANLNLVENFTVAEVKRCHRMGKTAVGSKPRPILVKFQTVGVRDTVWFAKTKLKGSGITISEFLTKPRHKVFMSAREQFSVKSCWTREGNIYVLGPDGTKHKVRTLSDLDKIRVDDQDSQAAVPKKTKRAAAMKK